MSKICFITAIFGNYETSCKPFTQQTVETDYICFTDNPHIISNGWTIDTTPYHLTHKSHLDTDTYRNSISNNQHTFNVSKYYKQSFTNIPRLQPYDIVVWMDGTIEILYDKTSEYILTHIYEKKIIGWNHEFRNGKLAGEVDASHFDRYTSTYWGDQSQPYQDIDEQYQAYLQDGYHDEFFDRSTNPNVGVWLTCFVAFLKNDASVQQFLDLWYLQTLQYTTQDQIGFPYVCQKTNLIPFTLPNHEIWGDYPHTHTMLYKKHGHYC